MIEMRKELLHTGAACVLCLTIACNEDVDANTDDAGTGDSSVPEPDAPADAPPDALPADAGDLRWVRFVHSLSNLGAALEICVRPRSGDPPLKVPLTQPEFPDGVPYGAASGFVAIGPELTTENRLYFDAHRAPIDECPDFNGLSDAPPSFVVFGMVLLMNDTLRWFTTGPAGLLASPPGEPVSLCGPTFAEPCTSANANLAWFWASEDETGASANPSAAEVAVVSTLSGTTFTTVCWDPDDAGPASPILVADLEQAGLATTHTELQPLVGGRLFVLDGGGTPCASGTPIAELPLPASAVAPGAAASIAAGESGRIWLVGQVTQAPSSPAAGAKIVLLPGMPSWTN